MGKEFEKTPEGDLKVIETKPTASILTLADIKANRAIYVQQIVEAQDKYNALIAECDELLVEASKLGIS